MHSNIEPLAYSVAEAARVLGGISRPTMYRLIHQSGFPAFKVGSRTLIDAAGLKEWVKSQTGEDVVNRRQDA